MGRQNQWDYDKIGHRFLYDGGGGFFLFFLELAIIVSLVYPG